MSTSRNHFSIEPRPRMLKDFLIDDSNSCSSSGFKSFPRRLDEDHHHHHHKLRSRSKAAAAASSVRVSALQSIINAVKSIQCNTVKSPSILPRSLSRYKLSKKNSKKEIINDIKITVRIKDIIRWKSFRDDLVEEKPQPSDLASSPDHHHHCTTTTTATGSTNSTPCSSNGSSWCESDFTSEYLPSWSGNFEGYAEKDAHAGEKYLPCVGSKSMKATTESAVDTAVGPKELQYEEKEQRSPVSVLGFELEDEDEQYSASSFYQTLTNMEKTKQETIRRFGSLANLGHPTNLETWAPMEHSDVVYGDDGVEEKAKLMLNHVKATSGHSTIALEQLLMDLLIDELSSKRNNYNEIEYDSELMRQAKAWIKGEQNVATLNDMKESWNKFEGEQEEVSLQIENTLLNLLLDELLIDL